MLMSVTACAHDVLDFVFKVVQSKAMTMCRLTALGAALSTCRNPLVSPATQGKLSPSLVHTHSLPIIPLTVVVLVLPMFFCCCYMTAKGKHIK